MNKKLFGALAVVAVAAVGAAYFVVPAIYVAQESAPLPPPVVKTLFEAAKEGYADQAEKLLAGGAKIDEVGEKGQTPLIVSLVQSHEDVAKFLILKGADIKLADGRGLTAAHYAAANNQLEALKVLKDKGASLDLANKEGFTPINLAKAYRSKDTYEYLKGLGLKEVAIKPKAKKGGRVSAGPN